MFQKMTSRTLPLAIFGPTASGKTALAIRLAQRLDGVIINADSLQVYQDLPTLTARPSAEEEAQAPHRLFGFLSPDDKMDVGRWMRLARATAEEVRAGGKLPIFCGGTGFYLKALEEGLAPIPHADAKEAEARCERLGLEAFESEVFITDPALRGVFEAGDRQRLVRAWAVHRATGKPLSYWQAQPNRGGLGALRTFALMPDRTALYDRINQRFAAMMAQGAVAEVEALAAQVDLATLPIAQAIGTREILAMLSGNMTEAEAEAQASQATRNYAKRQMTWVRNQAINAIKLPYNSINAQQISDIAELIIAFIRKKA